MPDVPGLVIPSGDDGGEWQPAAFGPGGCLWAAALAVLSGGFWAAVLWLVWGS